MKRAIALIAALAAAACGGTGGSTTGTSSGPITADEARSAIPSQDQAKIDVPQQGSGLSSALTAAPRSGEITVAGAEFARLTIWLSGSVNLSVAAPLVLVRTIVDSPPTSCEGDTCTWGPGSSWHDLNEFKLTVTKVDDHYSWALSGRPKSDASAEFTPFIYGDAWPTDQRWVGHGNFTVDLDAAATKLDHFADSPTTGKVEVTSYDNRDGQQKVSVNFLTMADQDHAGHELNTAYQYQNGSGGGDLQVATSDVASGVGITLHSQWKSTGEGRGDAHVTDAPIPYDRSQCWDTAASGFALLYDSNPASGDASLCAFDEAPLTIEAP
jgi:hypothetical protein